MAKYTVELEFWADGDESEKYQMECLDHMLDSLDDTSISVRVISITKDAS